MYINYIIYRKMSDFWDRIYYEHWHDHGHHHGHHHNHHNHGHNHHGHNHHGNHHGHGHHDDDYYGNGIYIHNNLYNVQYQR